MSVSLMSIKWYQKLSPAAEPAVELGSASDGG